MEGACQRPTQCRDREETSAMRRSQMGSAVSVVLLALVAVGCQASGQSASQVTPSRGSVAPPRTSSNTPAETPPTTATSTSVTSPGTKASTQSRRPRFSPVDCATDQLAVTLTSEGAAAGTAYMVINFRNVSSRECSEAGYPGVSFVTGRHGIQVGRAAVRVEGRVPRTTVPPHHSAFATLAEGTAQDYPPHTCQPTQVPGLRIYPPNQTVPLFVAAPSTACANKAVKLLLVWPLKSSPPR